MGLGNWGEELQNAAGSFFGSDYLRDYTHASKTFRSDSYANAPKLKFLFHTYFNINTEAYPNAGQQNLGILVQEIKLPSYRFATTVLNQYNRKRIIQSKVNYEPINITFFDDNKNSVNKMWYSYFTYYYKDATNPAVKTAGSRGSGRYIDPNSNTAKATDADYDVRNIYTDDITGKDSWGYIGETNVPYGTQSQKKPFFKDIRIFGFNQHDFMAYILVNPIITNFSHDTYNYAESSGIMKNTMTIDYETVVYNQGGLDGRSPGDIVTGFGDPANYDLTTSPINKPGANGKVLGKGGLIDAAGGFFQDLADGNPLRAIQTAGTAYNTIKNIDIKNTIKNEIKAGLQQSVQNALTSNRNLIFESPIKGATPSSADTAGSKTQNAKTGPTPLGDDNFAGGETNVGGGP